MRRVVGRGGSTDRRRQMRGFDRSASAGPGGLLGGVAKLTDISRPGVVPQATAQGGVRVEIRRRSRRDPRDEVIPEARDVVSSLAKRRQVDRQDGEAVEQVGAERPVADPRLEVPVRRGDHSGPQLPIASSANRPVLADVEHAKQLRLNRRRGLRHLVEEDRAAARAFEQTGLGRVGPGERPALVPEQLALDQALRQGRQMNRHERLVRPVAMLVDRPRDEFLPRAALAGDQHRFSAGGRQSDLLEDDLHRQALPDDRAARRRRVDRLGRWARVPAPQGPIHKRSGLGEVKWFGQIVERAASDGAHRGLHRAVGGHHHDRQARPEPSNPIERRKAVEARQPHVEEKHIGRVLREAFHRLLGARGHRNPMAVVAEKVAERPANARLIIQHHHMGHASLRLGSVTRFPPHRDRARRQRAATPSAPLLDDDMRYEVV